jgi:predicted secreted protein
MRKLGVMFFFAVSMMAVYAGDVASFVSLGFSVDGSRYSFGQYGVIDGEYQAYAEIFCVDVAKNAFVKDGKFATFPSLQTSGKEGKGIFSSLQNRASSYLKKQGIDSSLQGRSLYIQAVDEPTLKTISFRDFENSAAYTIILTTLTEGSGKDVRASFYLVAEITDASGKIFRKVVGIPGYMRDGVKGYVIRRILCDESGKSLVFVIEKDLYDRNGTSVRFMVETLRL